ncbi:hypothetical protein XBI1_2140004 [Xenorhabdus bovienii str. Intermedium]|uniref:Uncharacterized protein n=1 Tax=Xenorhabdus bovienii str. Intermedium TaxID=1379677 RepID=A0A077QHV2_XENBV|nr:hypothetical protein XBI1_2140004 [Xenorhabdus bovienii str. Intermedium]
MGESERGCQYEVTRSGRLSKSFMPQNVLHTTPVKKVKLDGVT